MSTTSPRTTKRATTTAPDAAAMPVGEDLVVSAAAAAAALLPSAAPLTAGLPQPPALLAGTPWAGAAVAVLEGAAGTGQSRLGVLVGVELVEALAGSPIGELDLGAAVQPALDAAAKEWGASLAAAETVEAAGISALLEQATTAVPLLDGTTTAAVLFAVLPDDASVPTAPSVGGRTPMTGRPGIELLHGVSMEVTVEIGRTRMSVRDLLALSPGDVLELDRAAGSPADLLVNGRLIARGEVVVVDEDFALRVTEIVAPTDLG